MLGPSASSLANQVSLSDFLVSSPILSPGFLIIGALGGTSLLISAATIPLFNLTSVGISIVQDLIIELVFGGIQANQNRFNIILRFLADFLRRKLLKLGDFRIRI